jgi:uncharacterized protein (DUF1800 family)
MSNLSIAFNRFGLGARIGEAVPEDPRRWLVAQFERYEPRPAPIAAAPARAEVAGQLADYLEETRREQGAVRRAGSPRIEPPPAMQGAMDANDQLAGLPDSARRFIRGVSRRNYLAMAGARTNAALTAPAPFVERMVHFWSNHFAVSADKLTVIGLAGLLEFEAIRPHVLGRFRDMLVAALQHPAMLLYLDQAQSIGPDSQAAQIAARFQRGRQRRGLNENLAREILELHTLGVNSGYGQADVTEFARALTGWTVRGLTRGPAARFAGVEGTPGDFVFAQPIHEPGARTIVGKTYRQDGERQGLAVLDDLAADPRTARHLATKLARHFAGDDPPAAMVERLTQTWLRSGGDLPTI